MEPLNKTRKKILIAGGAGYLGSHTCVALQEKGYLPVIADNFSNSKPATADRIASITGIKPETEEVDFTDREKTLELFRTHNFDGVIHFAALKSVSDSVKNPIEYYRNNIVSTINILEAMEDKGCMNMVFSSSCTVYGQPENLPVDEHAPFKKASSPYGETKQICEQILSGLCDRKDFSVVSLRYFNPIGAHPSGLIGEFPSGTPNNLLPYLTGAVTGKFPPLNIYGTDYDTPDGTCIRDYIHVCDLAEAHVAALEKIQELPGFNAINIGTGKGYSVKEILRKFVEVNKVEVPAVEATKRPGDVPMIWGDTKLAKEKLGWVAERNLDDMLRDAWNWEKTLNSKNEQP